MPRQKSPLKALNYSPQKEEENKEARDAVYEQLYTDIHEVYRAMYDLATGIYVEEIFPGGVRRVYKKAPDQKAAAALLDRAFGTPIQRSESQNRNFEQHEHTVSGTLEGLLAERARELALESSKYTPKVEILPPVNRLNAG